MSFDQTANEQIAGSHRNGPSGANGRSRLRRVLVVEDDEDVGAALAAHLENAGHLVSNVANGVEALQSLRDGLAVDLILLDLTLPHMDGWEFRVKQRADPRLSHIPVIAMSGDSSPKAAAVDADAFLPKPVSGEALCLKVERILALVERERSRATQMAQTERMASLGMLAAGVGHEINNPLAYILGNIEHALTALKEDAASPASLREAREALEEAREGGERIRRIVRDLRIFSRIGQEQREAVNLHRALELAINMSWNEIRHRGRLVKNLGPAPLVEGDESRLGQLFINLIINAAQSLDELSVDRNAIHLNVSTDDRGRAMVEVRDNGQGISDADMSRIFEPFFTTKADEGGSGLGLAIAYETVRNYGGELQVESELGKGSTFRVILPPWAATNESSKSSGSLTGVIAASAAKRGRILIVDDELALAKVLERRLLPQHDTIIATSGAEAAAILERDAAFDLILCDLMMVGMSGMQLYRRLHGQSPLLADRMVFMTGGAFSPASRRFLEEVNLPRFEKPFDLSNLQAFINQRLATRAQGG